MIDTRRKHFYLGRTAAHNAISSLLGQDKTPILKGKRGEPIWPEGIIGAITHTGKIAIAAVVGFHERISSAVNYLKAQEVSILLVICLK